MATSARLALLTHLAGLAIALLWLVDRGQRCRSRRRNVWSSNRGCRPPPRRESRRSRIRPPRKLPLPPRPPSPRRHRLPSLPRRRPPIPGMPFPGAEPRDPRRPFAAAHPRAGAGAARQGHRVSADRRERLVGERASRRRPRSSAGRHRASSAPSRNPAARNRPRAALRTCSGTSAP